ncbi:MAG: hypothetical protein EBU90_00285 [Proteobacteria bacterium]|nr:hypothetical protein [Pseudomonadota bacterium]NBP12869.1 hypothetical protein [bacterium]
MSKSKIEFIADTKEMLDVLERPYPAIQKLPEWISNTPSYIGGHRGVDEFSDPNTTIKKCMPLFDSITAGYHIPLHSDVWVENGGASNINIKWSWDTIQVVDITKQEQIHTYPYPEGHYPTAFKWINPWIVKTPPGWSCIFTHPFHHDHLPFKSLTGIVDTDKHPIPVNFIFFLNKNFEGLIEKGTPMIQVIPFKRSTFKSEFSYDTGFFRTQWQKAHTVFFDRYKRFFRSQKKYEQGEVKKCPFAFLHK